MYLRTTQRRNRDGSTIRYVQVAHNRRVEGVTQAEVLLNLGREDRLDAEGPASRPAPAGRPTPPALVVDEPPAGAGTSIP